MDRTRRLRQTAVMRSMVRENHVRTEELIYPLFVMEGENIVQPVESMPGICQYSVDRMNEELDRVKALQIPAILIFGIPEHKDEVGSGAYDEHGIVQTAIRRIKKDYPDLLVIADVCLCEYTSHGHCGLIRDGIILNDETLPLLAQTAVSYARFVMRHILRRDSGTGKLIRWTLQTGVKPCGKWKRILQREQI